MRDAKERKKILAQAAELERDSVNYFDVDKEFFLIDSDNLDEVQTRLYGYSIQADGIYEDDNLTPEAVKGLDGRGCYIYVEACDGQITIRQDLNGCWGIYLFRNGDHFALSNSFFRLLDHVKFRYPLTVNRDFCNYFMISRLTSHIYSDTAVNEIQLVDRSAILHIDTAEKNLRLEATDYREYTVPLDSPEGMATLDRWVEFWGDIFRGVVQHSKFILADLTGGFDSRISFILLMNSGVDRNKIYLNSHTGSAYTEDYKVATEIAARYGLNLNQPPPECRFLNYSLADSLNIDLYHRQTFKKFPGYPRKKFVDKKYTLSGYAGEIIRNYWHMSPTKFIKVEMNWAKNFSNDVSREIACSVKTLIETVFEVIRDKYKIANSNSADIIHYLYKETRCRSHFGKNTLQDYFRNNFTLAPVLDPIIQTLRLATADCPDPNLLMSIIFTRYEPDLLQIPFEKDRLIAPETVAFARKLNERFPRRLTTDKIDGGRVFHLQPIDARAEKIFSSGRNNKEISDQMPRNVLKAVFDSSRTYGLFCTYFDAEIYRYAATYYDGNKNFRERYSYFISGLARVLEDVEISLSNHPLYKDAKRFLELDFAQVH